MASILCIITKTIPSQCNVAFIHAEQNLCKKFAAPLLPTPCRRISGTPYVILQSAAAVAAADAGDSSRRRQGVWPASCVHELVISSFAATL